MIANVEADEGKSVHIYPNKVSRIAVDYKIHKKNQEKL